MITPTDSWWAAEAPLVAGRQLRPRWLLAGIGAWGLHHAAALSLPEAPNHHAVIPPGSRSNLADLPSDLAPRVLDLAHSLSDMAFCMSDLAPLPSDLAAPALQGTGPPS